MSQFHEKSKDVRRELLECEAIRRKFGGDKKFVIPKTMIIGKRTDGFARKVLLSSSDQERYNVLDIAEELGYNDSVGITHEGIDIENEVGRVRGECSLILEKRFLRKFAKVIVSEELQNTLQRKNTIVAYPFGNRRFLLGLGQEFINRYSQMLQGLNVSSNLNRLL